MFRGLLFCFISGIIFSAFSFSADNVPAQSDTIQKRIVISSVNPNDSKNISQNEPNDLNDQTHTTEIILNYDINQSIIYISCFIIIILALFCIYLWKKERNEDSLDLTLKPYLFILQRIEEGVIITNLHGAIISINQTAANILGWNLGKNSNTPTNIKEIIRIFSNDGTTPIESPLNKAIKLGHEITCNGAHDLLVTPSGAEHYISYQAIPLKNLKAQIVAGIFMFKDLSERIAIKEQLKHSQKLESVGRLAGGIAHDFNNMIGAISGTTEVMMLQVDENDSMMRYLRRIFATAIKASELTNRLLAFTRKSSTHTTTSFNLSDTVKEALEIIERSIDPKVEVLANFKNNNCPLIGDPSAIENMVINLCLNANDAMPEGGKLSVNIYREELDKQWCEKNAPELSGGEYAVLSVQDTGIGIPSQRIKNIFEPFYTTKDVGKGSGLGLAAVYTTISEHCGAIKVYSEPGEGTEFTIYFPISCKIGESINANSSQSNNASSLQCGSGTILLADDEEYMRDAGRMMLESLGYEVLLAENGEKAVEMYERYINDINIIILDMVMPRMNGRDAFKKIININPEAKIIIASGFSREARINNLFNDGLKAFVKKPYRQAEISEILQNVINNQPASNQQ